MAKLNADQIRKSKPSLVKQKINLIKRNAIVLVLDNVQDTYNIGSFFRLADAIAAQAIYICGSAVTPPNLKIHRSSVGTWKWIPWFHCQQTAECVKGLKRQKYQIVSCEINNKSTPYNNAHYCIPMALIAGSESFGISPDVIKLSDLVVEIPMYGINNSLNTLLASSIVAYQALSQYKNTCTKD